MRKLWIVSALLAAACGSPADEARAVVPAAAKSQEAAEGDDLLQAAAASDAVAIGTVAAFTSERSKNEFGDDVIYTDLDVVVAERLKGDLPARLTVRVEGGTVIDTDGAELTQETSDGPLPRVKERAIFFVGPSDGTRRPARAPVLVIEEEQVRGSGTRVEDVRRRVQ